MDRLATAEAVVDAAWYAQTYPQAREDIARGRAQDPVDHYLTLGRFRGYLPNPRAERPENPAAPRSAFGGLWTDQGNALDLVEGQLRLGLITRREAADLHAFITQGFVVLPQAVPWWTVTRARRALDQGYAGRIKGLQFAAPELGFELGSWDPRVREVPAKALEIHARSAAIRDAIFAPRIGRFLALVFQRPALASQSLGFYRGSGQNAHQDTAYVTYSLPMHFVASWIALEDVMEGAGELFYRVGSQALGEFRYAGRYKSVSEAQRLAPDWDSGEMNEHVESILSRCDQEGHAEQTFLARRGDALIWSADLAHGGKPISAQATRRSVVTHYCPAEVAPLYFENTPARAIRRHRSGHVYSTFL